MKVLFGWIKTNSVMLINAGSLVGTTVVTSILGFAFWWVAARLFTQEAVGIASASISIMTLLGTLCVLGLGTLLVTELPRQPGQAVSLISTALVIVGAISVVVGFIFGLVAPILSPQFATLNTSIIDTVLFAAGVSLTTITLVFDQALIGLLRGGQQLFRNTLFAVVKLVALLLVSFLVSKVAGMTIYVTWMIGNLLSLAVIVVIALLRQRKPLKSYVPQWSLLRKLGATALQHHLLNITLQFPGYGLPVLVTVLLSAKMNALFYISWMIVNFMFYIPVAFTMVLHAMNSAQQSALSNRIRTTIGLAFVISLLGACLLQFTAKQVLGVFNHSYVEAAWTLRILTLAAFPLVIKNHYISICRIHDWIKNAMLLIIPGCFLELGAAAAGAHFGGLAGLSLCWVVATYVETMFMLPTIYKVVIKPTSLPIEQSHIGIAAEAIWLLDTSPLPAMNFQYTEAEAIWAADTAAHPIVQVAPVEQVIIKPSKNNIAGLVQISELVQVAPVEQANIKPSKNNIAELVEVASRHNGSTMNRLKPTKLQKCP